VELLLRNSFKKMLNNANAAFDSVLLPVLNKLTICIPIVQVLLPSLLDIFRSNYRYCMSLETWKIPSNWIIYICEGPRVDMLTQNSTFRQCNNRYQPKSQLVTEKLKNAALIE
jgi:hypothetical protein